MEDPVKLWLKFAERDLKSAKRNYEIGEYYVSAFLAQQSAEKALKAVHIKETGGFPKSHDLTRLARLINAPEKIIELCAEITPAYTATRYPDVAEEFDKKDVEDLIKNAEKVIEWAKKRLI